MYKGKTILAVIPARGGSKGLIGKNIKLLCGKPLINWTIEAALSCEYIDTVLVSTDDEKIAKVSRKAGAETPFLRPEKLARDGSKVIDTILHALDFYRVKGQSFDYVVLLEPTSPLRKNGDLAKAVKKLIEQGPRADSIVSIGEIPLEHPVYAKKISADGLVVSYSPTKLSTALRQDVPVAYFPYGVIYAARVCKLPQLGAPYGGKMLPWFIERWQCYEINDGYDFACVEAVLKLRRIKK